MTYNLFDNTFFIVTKMSMKDPDPGFNGLPNPDP